MSIIQSETPGTIFRLCLPVLVAKTVGDSYRGRVVDVVHEVNVRALRQRVATGQDVPSLVKNAVLTSVRAAPVLNN